jgi:hypothetical protein
MLSMIIAINVELVSSYKEQGAVYNYTVPCSLLSLTFFNYFLRV